LCAGATEGLVEPITAFSHDEGRAVIGGLVYRGTAMPGKYGRYIFSDLGIGPIFELLPDGNGGYSHNQIETVPTITTSLAAGADGEIYFVT